jgi:hypothetical protein
LYQILNGILKAMAIITVEQLKLLFESGDSPRSTDYINMIDTLAALPEAGAGGGLSTVLVLANKSKKLIILVDNVDAISALYFSSLPVNDFKVFKTYCSS